MEKNHNETIKSISKDIRYLCHEKDEESITKEFIAGLKKSHRIRTYSFTHMQESVNGCDWLWIIATNVGAYYFATQAKKLHNLSLRRWQAYYHKKHHKPQIKRLRRFATRIGAAPIYVLYSNKINIIQGCPGQYKTDEGVFFDYAPQVDKMCSMNKLREETPFPISCMFYHFSKMCAYEDNRDKEKKKKLCVACKQCIRKIRCRKDNAEEKKKRTCILPFRAFFQRFYNADIQTHNVNNAGMLLLLYGQDLLSDNERYLSFAINMLLGKDHPLIKQIIVQDYMIKHEKHFAKALMGEDFVLDESTILDPIEIEHTITELRDKYGFFKRIGFFGSYARYYFNRDTPKKPNNSSDIDIVFEYNCQAFRSEADLLMIPEFIKSAFSSFHKNIDFVDYNTCDEQFAISIREKIRWIP